jgi:8-hydroxy-5-deazaflavin:NADPH oxidoreductase
MRYAVLGTGMVGQALATKLAGLGNEAMMGSRTASNEKARAWQERVGARGRTGTFREAAAFGEVLVSCTEGLTSLEALRSADTKDLDGKVLIDVSNPLDFSRGMPASLSVCNTDSLGETLQREFPKTKVVKTLNTCNCQVMVDPARVAGEHDMFVCGNDAEAKEHVNGLLREFGWRSIIDLGDITGARATEQLLPIWLRLFGMFGTPEFNFRVVRAGV